MNFIAAAAAGVGRSGVEVDGKKVWAVCWLSCITASLLGVSIAWAGNSELCRLAALVFENRDERWLVRDGEESITAAVYPEGEQVVTDGLGITLPLGDKAFASEGPRWRRRSCMAADAAGVGSAS